MNSIMGDTYRSDIHHRNFIQISFSEWWEWCGLMRSAASSGNVPHSLVLCVIIILALFLREGTTIPIRNDLPTTGHHRLHHRSLHTSTSTTEISSVDKPWIFYHVRKCAGWTILKYFEKFLYCQADNKCNNKQKNPKDWRCMIGGFERPSPSIDIQVTAFKLFAQNYSFSHVEVPLKATQIFVSNIRFITVVRHPIERVLSSYVMMKDKASFENCTLGLWFHRQCYLNPKVQLGRDATSTIGRVSKLSGSFTTGELDKNYMTRWLSGVWSNKGGVSSTSDLIRAKSNLNHMDFVFLTSSLSRDLPRVSMHFLQSEFRNSSLLRSDIPNSVMSKDVRVETIVDISIEALFCGDVNGILKRAEGSVALYQEIIAANEHDIELYLHAINLYCNSFIREYETFCRDPKFSVYYEALVSPATDYFKVCNEIIKGRLV